MSEQALPAPPVPEPDEEVLDFTVVRRRVLFRIDDDVFEAAPALPTGFAVEIANVAERLRDLQASNGEPGAGVAARLEGFFAVFDRLLKPGSRERFRQRLHDVEHPVDPEQISRIIQGLLARYGLRPTTPSPGSSPPPSNPAAGTSSTDAPPAPASISAGSPSTGS